MPDFTQGLILTADPVIATEIREFAATAHPRLLFRSIQELSDEAELDSLVRIYSPSILFLDMDDVDLAQYVCGVVRERIPHAQIIGFARDLSKEALLAAVRFGLRDVLQYPLSASSVIAAVQRAMEKLDASGVATGARRSQIFCFLPAKAGSGASTVAIHAAAALSQVDGAGRKAALLDLDFECGVVDFLLNEPCDNGVKQMLEYSSRIDESLWQRAVQKVGNLDVVRTGSHGRPVSASEAQMRGVLAHARANYDFVCLDLPEQLNEASLAALEYCDEVLLVCTPDLVSAHLTRRRLSLLRECGYNKQVRVILNRHHSKSHLSKTDMEELLNAEIFAVVDNDYPGIQSAVLKGRLVESSSPMGKQFVHLATRLAGIDTTKKRNGLGQDGIWQNLKRLIGLAGSGTKEQTAKTARRPLLLPPASTPTTDSASSAMSGSSIAVLDLSRTSL